MLEDLRWLGLDWDEGPDTGGPHGPYRQSERLQLYRDAPRRARRERGEPTTASARPTNSRPAGRAALAAGEPPEVRAAAAADWRRPTRPAGSPPARRPRPCVSRCRPGRDITFTDLVRGPVTFSTDVIGDPVILRSDGRPAYNFSVVVDDARMAITHVIRGEDHISNTPRQILLYEALGPFAAAVRPPLARARARPRAVVEASRRDERGGVPGARVSAEALVNYLALLGWSPGEGEEIRAARPRWRAVSTSTRVSHSAAVFDTGKLAWMNRHYMKEAPASRIAARSAGGTSSRAGFVGAATDAALDYLDVAAADGRWVGRSAGGDSRPGGVRLRRGAETRRRARRVARPDGRARCGRSGRADRRPRRRSHRESFRAAAARAREPRAEGPRPVPPDPRGADCGRIRPELDLAVPAIERGAGSSDAGVEAVPPCRAHRAVADGAGLSRPRRWRAVLR